MEIDIGLKDYFDCDEKKVLLKKIENFLQDYKKSLESLKKREEEAQKDFDYENDPIFKCLVAKALIPLSSICGCGGVIEVSKKN